jgi:uncharacterized cupredoxin-like copper-binding protein
MNAGRHARALGALIFAVAGVAGATTLPQHLDIKLQDPTTNPSIKDMRMVLDHTTLKPGRVTLTADNESKSLVHEVLIAPDAHAAPLPFNAKTDRVIEKHVHSLGEIPDLAPGKSGSLTVNLKPGTYMLFCNQPGHYKDGMYAKLVVAR